PRAPAPTYTSTPSLHDALPIYFDRSSQAAFMMFSGQKDHRDEEVKEIQEYIEGNYGERMTVDELAQRVAMSRRSFERRFKQATGDRKSTRLNSSHVKISYAVFC